MDGIITAKGKRSIVKWDGYFKFQNIYLIFENFHI
jgi:hypothetical protein